MNFSSLTTRPFSCSCQILSLFISQAIWLAVCVADMLVLSIQIMISRKEKIYLASVTGTPGKTWFLKCYETPKHIVGCSDVDVALWEIGQCYQWLHYIALYSFNS
jgi:hypothetical protein